MRTSYIVPTNQDQQDELENSILIRLRMVKAILDNLDTALSETNQHNDCTDGLLCGVVEIVDGITNDFGAYTIFEHRRNRR